MTLTDEEITAISLKFSGVHNFARAIEARVLEELRKQEPVGFGCFDPAGFLDQDLVGTEADCIFWRDSPDATNKWTVKALFTAPIPTPSQEELIKSMVDRFLGWKLPKDFSPDNGVHFSKTYGGYQGDEFVSNIPRTDERWPIGTNLFSAEQARAMFEHCLARPDTEGSRP